MPTLKRNIYVVGALLVNISPWLAASLSILAVPVDILASCRGGNIFFSRFSSTMAASISFNACHLPRSSLRDVRRLFDRFTSACKVQSPSTLFNLNNNYKSVSIISSNRLGPHNMWRSLPTSVLIKRYLCRSYLIYLSLIHI